MIEDIANILGFQEIYKPLESLDNMLGESKKPTNELTLLKDYYKTLIAEDKKNSDLLKKELQSNQAIILRHFIDLLYKTLSHQNYIILNTRHSLPKAYRNIESLAHYWKTKKHQLNDEAYLRTTIENNIDYYQIVEVV